MVGDVSVFRRMEEDALARARTLRTARGKIVAKNDNGSYRVVVDGATYSQVWSINGIDYAPTSPAGGSLANPVIVQVAIDGLGRASIIP